ncbi:hypothetical protein BJV74DRAFT_161468 [Russula compacta]|nr:hypothetical protein BJV74DRAFT_161468 [Russula compacta]
MAGAVIQAVDIQNTFGAAFVGLLLSAILYGVTIVQTWAYFLHHCERDTNAFKGFVAFLFTMDTAHLVLCIYTIYWYLILNFGNVEALEFNMWAMETQISVNTLVGYFIQLYYARRAFIMGKNIVLPLVIAFLGGICFTLGFVYTARTAVIGEFSHYGSALIWVTCRTGFSRTDSMIMTLMIYSINTGLLTSLLSSATLVSFSISPSTLISQVFFWPLSKCYFNSLLAM